MTDFLGSLVGQGSGVSVGNPGSIPAVSTNTDAFKVYTNFGDYAGSGAYTNFTKLGTVPQLEMERRFPEFLSEVDKLRGMAAPTASLFRTTALGQINNAESQALGNVREQLARRGLSGASFGLDTQARVQGEFAQKRAETELAAANQEINLTSQLVDFQNTLINQQLNRELQELGLATGVTTNLVNMANQNLAVQAQLSMAQAQIDFVDWQQRVKSGGELIGVGAGLGAGLMFASDRRLKTDIRKVGVLDNGLPVYIYRFKNSQTFHMGVMADEVERAMPEAVTVINGYQHVYYGML